MLRTTTTLKHRLFIKLSNFKPHLFKICTKRTIVGLIFSIAQIEPNFWVCTNLGCNKAAFQSACVSKHSITTWTTEANNSNPGSTDCPQMHRCCCIKNEQLYRQCSCCLHLMRQSFVLLLGDDSFDQDRRDTDKHIYLHTSRNVIRAPDKWSRARGLSLFFLLMKATEICIVYINSRQTLTRAGKK